MFGNYFKWGVIKRGLSKLVTSGNMKVETDLGYVVGIEDEFNFAYAAFKVRCLTSRQLNESGALRDI